MARGTNSALHPNRQVGAARFIQGNVASPTPDGGISSRDAGPTIQANWETLRDQGMSAQEATDRLHTLPPPPAIPGGPPSPWWLNGQVPMNSDPNQAVMSGPTTVNNGSPETYDIEPRYTNSYGPVADILNDHQSTLA